MTETQLIELLRSQIAAEREVSAALDQIDADQARITERYDAAHAAISSIRKDTSWTKYRLMTVIAGKDDPGPDRDMYMQRQADLSNRGTP